MELTNAVETEVSSYRYSLYGAVTISVGGVIQASDPLGQPWTFASRFHDPETEFIYSRARYYSPNMGVFLGRDPLGYLMGGSLYGYASSRPTMLTDPRGLAPCDAEKEALNAAQQASRQAESDAASLQSSADGMRATADAAAAEFQAKTKS